MLSEAHVLDVEGRVKSCIPMPECIPLPEHMPLPECILPPGESGEPPGESGEPPLLLR